jgi:autotransporter-associated beta strand protein
MKTFLLSLGLSAAVMTLGHAASLLASDGATSDQFGYSVSQSGSIGLSGANQAYVGAPYQGAAYVFRSLDTANGTINQSVKLTASDGGSSNLFGNSVSQSGSIGLIGAYQARVGNRSQGAAYVFRDLDTATGTITQNAKLTASDGAGANFFGQSVSLSGSIGLVGADQAKIGTKNQQGAAYVFRSLDTATGTITQNAKLTASDGVAFNHFGYSVSQSGSIGLVGAYANNNFQGAAYVFRSLDTATGNITENVKLTASDGGGDFGLSVSQSGSIGLVGAPSANLGTGAAYVFRSLDTATGTITQNVKLTVSDGANNDYFGYSVSQSGSIGLVGARNAQIGANFGQGAAYVFRSLDTATGTITQNVKLTASDGANNDNFGWSVGLDGDQFVIGALKKNSSTGKAYSGSVASVSTLDTGSTSKTISGISFVSQDDWIIGQTTNANSVTLSAGDTANVSASGKAVYIGQNAGSNNNTLVVAGNLTANQINVGTSGNTGNVLQIGNGGTTGTLSTSSVITNNGTVVFNRSDTITQGTEFGSGAITGNGSLTQAGSGSTILTASNTYTGGTTISGGTLQLGNGSTTGSLSSTGAIVNNGNLAINRSNAVTQGTDFSATAITGNGSLTQAGSGTTLLTASNTYTGGTTISGGTLQLGNGSTTGSLSSTGAIVNNGNFTINRSNTVTQGTDFSGTAITGTGSFTQAGSGTTILNAANSYSGGTFVQAGTLRAGNTSAFGSGAISVSGGFLDFNGFTIGNTLNVSGGSLTGLQNYTGTQAVSGTAAYSGTVASNLNVTSGGKINTTGATFTGAINVGSGGTLAGSGTVNSIAGAGTVGPGNSPGILTAQTLDLSGGADFKFELTTATPTYSNASASGNDVLHLTDGTAPITGTATDANVFDIYLNVTTLTSGDFLGGIFTDKSSDFSALVLGGTYNYYVKGDGLGTNVYNSLNYYTLGEYNISTSSTWTITASVAPVPSADFAGGTVSGGFEQKFTTAVPEPSTYAMLLLGMGAVIWFRSKRKQSSFLSSISALWNG